MDIYALKKSANERYFKKSGKYLDTAQMACLDIIKDIDTVPAISFYNNKIKVMLEYKGTKYMIDFDIVTNSSSVLLGIFRNNKYSLKTIKKDELAKYITSMN